MYHSSDAPNISLTIGKLNVQRDILCFTIILYLDTCTKAIQRNGGSSTRVYMKIGGATEEITCGEDGGKVYMMFSHNKEYQKKFHEVTGSSATLYIGYTNSHSYIQKAIQQSARCVQKFYVIAEESDYRDTIFTGYSGTSINAGDGRCIGCSGVFVNVDGNRRSWLKIEDKSLLHLTSVRFGDVNAHDEYVYITMGKLMCEDLVRWIFKIDENEISDLEQYCIYSTFWEKSKSCK